jgi:hypothetical protein
MNPNQELARAIADEFSQRLARYGLLIFIIMCLFHPIGWAILAVGLVVWGVVKLLGNFYGRIVLASFAVTSLWLYDHWLPLIGLAFVAGTMILIGICFLINWTIAKIIATMFYGARNLWRGASTKIGV